MKKFTLLLIMFVFNSLAQSHAEFIIGKWDIVALDDGDVSYDSRTNQIKLSTFSTKNYSHDELELVKEKMKILYFKNKYNFNQQGNLILHTPYFGDVHSQYQIINQKNEMVITGKNSLEEDVSEIYTYLIDGENLHLIIPLEEKPLKLILEKAKL